MIRYKNWMKNIIKFIKMEVCCIANKQSILAKMY